MLILSSVLIIILIGCGYKIIVDYQNLRDIKEQLELALHNNERFDVKISGFNKSQNELIGQINQLNYIWRETEAKYARTTQQSKEMISSITHDFRTPLTSMLGYVQILQGIPDSQTQLKYLGIIEERTKALTKLVDDFYEVSILDSDEYPVLIQKLNPKIVLQNQLSMYYEDLSTHFQKIQITIDDEVVICQSDVKALNRIFGNLIKNALNHGINRFEVSSTLSDNLLIIAMSNEIKEKEYVKIDKLFERTFRNDVTRNINSTGLGLSIAKELAELIKCDLSVKQKYQTISFILKIPLN